jgi:hypothetical protein
MDQGLRQSLMALPVLFDNYIQISDVDRKDLGAYLFGDADATLGKRSTVMASKRGIVLCMIFSFPFA